MYRLRLSGAQVFAEPFLCEGPKGLGTWVAGGRERDRTDVLKTRGSAPCSCVHFAFRDVFSAARPPSIGRAYTA